jgi:hypothetical protein
MFLRAILKQSILEIKHNLSGKFFQSLLLFTINEFHVYDVELNGSEQPCRTSQIKT